MSTNIKQLIDELCPNGVEWKTLGEVCYVTSGGTPSKSKKEYWENGIIPWLKSEVCNNTSIYSASDFITELGLKNSSTKLLEKNITLMAMVGATRFKTAFWEFEAYTNQNIASINSKIKNKLSNKFIFYYLTNKYDEFRKKMSSYGMINLETIRSINIPIPPMEEQERIVGILDKFNKLINDLSIGLPAEIQARKKQYEYYRNKLLTFKEKDS
ncbi:MAG TPA: restriction endonuclease subunit S [Ignavibacteriales bacterium]|nr:restriction endonuclease subunit S [Ignavibacteriales bacterium]HOL80728.1 restriction endonuclease subunit S [Ignavibacteriales bacterium]HOM64416.1 restriction endonuclease subunit S [Ignavibacteriales bacterium]HPD67204.1 restriction endonuclease subunit S [Ignavibacteriales bacterium]HPP32939.1 restriction endonuclease subunit S [Ignavibacteriales bacterium]